MISLTLKTLRQESFKVEIDENLTILALKEKIAAEHSEYAVNHQKLIYAGKILSDDNQIKDYDIKPKGFIVVMSTSKPGSASSSKPPASTSESPTPIQPTSTPEVAAAAPPPPSSTNRLEANTIEQPPNTPDDFSESTLLTGEGLEAAVKNIVAMGFPETLVRRALTVSFNNPDKAVELLVNNDELLLSPVGQSSSTEAPVESSEAAPAGENTTSLDFLRSHSQFQYMRQLIQTNPQLLQTLLQEIKNKNPELFRAINENREEFIRLLNTREESDETTPPPANVANPQSGEPGNPPMTVIELTEEENRKVEDIMNCCQVNKNIALEAFLSCDKNENLAVNYIFDNKEEFN